MQTGTKQDNQDRLKLNKHDRETPCYTFTIQFRSVVCNMGHIILFLNRSSLE